MEPQSANALRFYVGILPKPGDGRLVMFNVTQCPNDAACLVLRAKASGVSGPKTALFSGFPRGRHFYAFGSRPQVLDNTCYTSCAVESQDPTGPTSFWLFFPPLLNPLSYW